ncbi:hypothetical protein ACYOEI_16730 [Singulisphaera rosea]
MWDHRTTSVTSLVAVFLTALGLATIPPWPSASLAEDDLPTAKPGGALPESGSTGKAMFGAWGVETRHFSRHVQLGDDFFTYVNEGWIKTTKLPADSWDFGAFSELSKTTEQDIRNIILDACRSKAPVGDPKQQILDLRAGFIDTDRLEKLGLSPIQAELDEILDAPAFTTRRFRPGRGLVSEPPDGQRKLQRFAQRDRTPRRHPAAPLLRPERRPRGQFRIDRRDHRPRDGPRLRRPGG